MGATQTVSRETPCAGPLPDLEIPMITTMVTCLGTEHRRLGYLVAQMAFAATRLAAGSDATAAKQRALEIWDEIRGDLWSHLQIEDELVLEWGAAHQAVPSSLMAGLKRERDEMRKLMAALPAAPGESQTFGDGGELAHTLLALARTLDSHVERYDGEVLPSILRAAFNR